MTRFQPPSFTHAKFPNYRYHLQIAIYGLKQAPHGWFHRCNSYLLFLSFKARKANPSLFIYASSNGGWYLLLHANDILVTIDTLFYYGFLLLDSCRNVMNDLGPLHYFLGIKAPHHS